MITAASRHDLHAAVTEISRWWRPEDVATLRRWVDRMDASDLLDAIRGAIRADRHWCRWAPPASHPDDYSHRLDLAAAIRALGVVIDRGAQRDGVTVAERATLMLDTMTVP